MYAAVRLVGWAMGSGQLSSSGVRVTSATSPQRALPHITIGFSPKATKHNRVTICSCFSNWSVCGWKEFKKSPGLVRMHPTPRLLGYWPQLSHHTYTAQTAPSQNCGVRHLHRGTWLAGPDANQGEPRNSTEAEAMQHLLRTFRKKALPTAAPATPTLFPLVLPADVWQKGSKHRWSGKSFQSGASGQNQVPPTLREYNPGQMT